MLDNVQVTHNRMTFDTLRDFYGQTYAEDCEKVQICHQCCSSIPDVLSARLRRRHRDIMRRSWLRESLL
jgi:hypothetical protein